MNAIEFKQVTKCYGRSVALDQASFDVPEGSVFALLGDNGAGKTTCIKLMLGMTSLQTGQVSVLGLDPKRDDLEIRRRIGYVPEQPQFYDWMTVDEAGWFLAGFHHDGALEAYREQMKRLGVPLAKRIRDLSKGMRGKCSLGLAICHDPALLILDEPTSGLDPVVRRAFLEQMVERASTGKTVFLSSHQVDEVERVADHVAVLRDGRLMTAGPLEQIKERISVVAALTSEASSPLPPLADEVTLIRHCRRGRQWEMLVDGASDAALAELAALDFVEHVELRRPSLEEIVMGYLEDAAAEEATV